MNARKEVPIAAPPKVEGGAPAAPPIPPAPVAPSPPPPEAPRARRLARHLPRAGLILFLLAILVVFRGVLLPFVLAVFFAYLIYPVVSRLERIPIGRRHPPRWLAVISVYAVLFIVGWWTLPPLFANFAEQVGKLLQDVPTLFERLQAQRKGADARVARMFEVRSISETTRMELYADVDALAEGRVVPFVPPEGLELPPLPPPQPEEPAEPPPSAGTAPTIVQLIGINLHLGPGARTEPEQRPKEAPAPGDAKAPEEGGATSGAEIRDGEETSSGAADPEPAARPQDPTEPAPRFDQPKGAALKLALRDAIDAELEKSGPAKDVPAKVEREIVPELAARELALPPDDPQVRLFARNCGGRVAAAIRREGYAAVLSAYIESAVNSARTWVQDELQRVAGLATGVVAGLVRGIFDFFMVLMLTAFFLVFFPRVRDYGRDLVAPQYREDYVNVLKRIDVRLSGAIRGQVIICIVNAVLTFPGLWLIGAHTDATNLAAYAVLLSVIAGVLSMIPIFGVIFSTVPMVVLALAQGSVWAGVLVIGWICVIHAIEAYLLNPNILGHSASMNPIIVVFALLAGKQVYGLVGALLAVPVASVLVSLFGYYRRLVTQGAGTESGEAVVDRWGD